MPDCHEPGGVGGRVADALQLSHRRPHGSVDPPHRIMGIEARKDYDSTMTDKVIDPVQPRRAVVSHVIEVFAFTARREEEDDRDGNGRNGGAVTMRGGGLEQQVAAGGLAVPGDHDAVVICGAGPGRRLAGWSGGCWR